MADPVMADLRWPEPAWLTGRFPVTRTGPRDPIPPIVRGLVFRRDGGTCKFCGKVLTIGTATLDHITPWSAGGSDSASNLRILCWPCNKQRSNHRTCSDDRPALPVCRECAGCAGEPIDPDMVPAFCGRCETTGRTWPEMTF